MRASPTCYLELNVEPTCSLSKADRKMALRPPQVCRGGTLGAEQCSWSYICHLCHTSCDTARSLAEHFVGKRHKYKLQSPEHQEQNDGICLSYFLKAHMKEDPIVGLEYIMEVKKDSSYTYSCRLCKVLNTDFLTIVHHIANLSHMERYIDKHFSYLLPPYRERVRGKGRRSEYVRVLRNAAVMILEQQGRKEIQVVHPESDGKTREAPEDTPPSKPESEGKTREAPEDTPPSKSESDCKTREAPKDTPPSKSESDGKTREAPEDTPPSKPESDGKTREASEDTPPSKPESDCKMREAIKDTPSKPERDGKTREASEDTPPSKPESDCKMREAIKDTPPSKPESDGKTREASEDTPPSKPESDGKTREAIKDTPPSKHENDGKTRGASEDTLPSKPESDSKMREAIKDTPPSKPECGNSYHSKFSPIPYQETGLNESRESYRYNKMLQKSSSNDPPLAKRSRRSPGGDQDALPSTVQISKHGSSHYESHVIRMDYTATQKLEFRANNEFFEYFDNFVISDDDDVLFIRTITQNCIKALTSFQEEDAERLKTGHQPEAPLVDTSRTAQKIPGILEDGTESHLSDSKTTLLKDNSNPPSDSISKNEATALFFKSIKDMDESEVVRFFQKLAATNPEFQDIDIPTVIRFLKYSGRLKKP